MNKIIAGIASLAIGAFCAASASADGGARGGSIKDAPTAGPSCGSSAFNWNGAYAGIQLGSANYRSAVAIEDVLGLSTTREETGFSIGGVIGYNLQRCNTVFGIEADLNWTDVDRSWGVNLGTLLPGLPPLFNATSSMDWYGSVKVRTGFAFDNLLLYATGGLAFANIQHKGANTGAAGFLPPGTLGFNSSETRFGLVVGLGTEYALSNRITWRTEASYTRFEDKDFTLNFVGTPVLKLNAQDDLWMLKTGLNFKF